MDRDWSLYVSDPRFEWITTRDAVARLRTHYHVVQKTRYLRELVQRGLLPGYLLDGTWYVDWRTLDKRFGDAIAEAAQRYRAEHPDWPPPEDPLPLGADLPGDAQDDEGGSDVQDA